MALTMSYDSQTRNLLSQAMQQTSRFKQQVLWKDAVKIVNTNQNVVRMRLIDKRRENAKVKAKVKRDILGRPQLIEFLGLPVSPYIKFRRMARAVKMLIGVCHVCRSLLVNSVSQENWFSLLDNLVAATTLQQSQKKGRAFVALVTTEKHKMEQLTFDINDYKQQRHTKDLFTDDLREIMRQRPGTRSPEQIMEVVRVLKAMSKQFCEYSLAVQKKICQYAFYDKYLHNRVIIRRGLPPDGIYFVISGTLISKPDDKRNPDELHAGEKFGEEDLVCGCGRRATVITRQEVELLFLHRFDYMEIFDMAADCNDPKNLNICRKDVVLRHFPLEKLEENPGTWSTLKYRYGRLIVKDSNEMEWIYVILSGEARVIARLKPDTIDIKARRQQIQKTIEQDSPFYKKKKILNFVSDRAHVKSKYSPATYHPGLRRDLMSAPPAPGHRKCLDDIAYKSVPDSPNAVKSVRGFLRSKSEIMDRQTQKLPKIEIKESDEVESKEKTENEENIRPTSVVGGETVQLTFTEISADKKSFYQRTGRNPGNSKPRPKSENLHMVKKKRLTHEQMMERLQMAERKRLKEKYTNAPNIKPQRVVITHEKETAELPAFVQVETLHPGQTFGLRSCLESYERGPSVSLVSGDCEVLAINKKFFLRHCDDAMFSLIRLKAKPFPQQSELVDRLDITLQWDEFKQETLRDYLRRRIRKH
ncbi:uncharacterized protein LOC133173092 [Saccostrea echinata]|uniref:uncharacterized protein LOC133173092 n=1 Tax=Saccostrea echinata TaxID=191078 RepID=UPI002A82FA05|nr:uncharacterized protein LOC133173092 [Saccostrea echinata]